MSDDKPGGVPWQAGPETGLLAGDPRVRLVLARLISATASLHAAVSDMASRVYKEPADLTAALVGKLEAANALGQAARDLDEALKALSEHGSR